MRPRTISQTLAFRRPPPSGTQFAEATLPKGKAMSTSSAALLETTLETPEEQFSLSSDSGLVTFAGADAAFCLAADEACPLSAECRRKDGALAELQAQLDDALGRIGRLNGLARLGELAAAIAHEIRNPLAGVSATAEMLLDDISLDDPHRDSVSVILGEIQRLDKTVRNLLDFARSHKPFVTRLDLREHVERVLAGLRAAAAESGVGISGTSAGDLPDALGDPDLLRQAFMNIALNAIQAMPGGGELNVRLFSSADDRGRWICAAFTDTGRGISAQDLQRIFDPFFTTKASGAGLGLAVSRKVVEAQGGFIAVDSRPGLGSTFTVSVPAA